jgi:NADH dehydrogenase [ubiquinone] 1 alpha subcomplex assembly factor 7
VSGLASRLADRIARHGPLPFEAFVEAALYDETDGFYATTGGAGRRGDFLTSPEVGPLFGAVLARALDQWWDELGRPDPFVVVEAGAGPATLARSVLAAGPACARALRYVLVERSAVQRARHAAGLPLAPADQAFATSLEPGDEDEGEVPPSPAGIGPLVVSLPELPAVRFTGVVVANELLDNLPFGLLVQDAGWRAAFVDVGSDGQFTEILLPPTAAQPSGLPTSPLGARVPVQRDAMAWLAAALDLVEQGRVVIIDYASDTAAMSRRPWRDWIRTYRGHERGDHPLRAPGTQDITCEVALDQLARVREPDTIRTQAQFLQLHGLDELVAEGRRQWAERAHVGDLDAMRARSRVTEADALTDPTGLGSFVVAEWLVPSPST